MSLTNFIVKAGNIKIPQADMSDVPPNQIEKIRELGRKLRFDELVEDAQWREIATERGAAFIRDLHKREGEIHITDNYSAPGTPFKRHAHPYKEVFEVYRGCMELTVNGRDEPIILEPGDLYYLLPDDGHSAYFPVETRYIATLHGGMFPF